LRELVLFGVRATPRAGSRRGADHFRVQGATAEATGASHADFSCTRSVSAKPPRARPRNLPLVVTMLDVEEATRHPRSRTLRHKQ
jgi:hypothetical protein